MDVHFPTSSILSIVLQALLLSSSYGSLEPYDLLYNNAVDAFYRSDYKDVVRYMEGALSSYAEVRQTKVRCRLRCQDQHPFDSVSMDLQFFDVVLRRSNCQNECIEEKVGTQSMHKVSEDVNQDFQRRIPYNYLQLAYQKLKQLDKAAAAAHTYFQANPEHVEMDQNLEQYKALEGSDQDHFVDREARPHQRSFSAGVKLYDSADYKGAIALFEEALQEYYRADVECRALCQGPQRFEEQDHVLYHYSLYELVSVNMVEEAMECAKSYLLFHEGEEFMTENLEYYREAVGHDVKPREKAEWYLRRHKQELELLVIGSENMQVEFTEGHYWTSTGGREDSNRIPSGTDGWMEYVPISEKKNFTLAPPQELREGGPLVYDSVQLVQNSKALNGTQRVLLDDVISVDECAELTNLAHNMRARGSVLSLGLQTVTMAGDGYRGKMSPHTPNERFEGATVLKTLQYGYEGRVPLRSARLFYDASERARRIIESYFLLNSTLHFSYTHLVCRTAITGQQDHRNDLSHPIHADNCLLDPEANECWKEPPAYTYRDYSALLYLNGDFEGGEFIFTEMDAKTVTAQVKPKCGRMVGFSSGGENPHGVRAVTRGQRCAVALWFTLDPLFRELERLQADEVMQALDNQSSQSQWDTSLNINPKDEL
ncbi:prolyl 3-hydroxylase 2 isoform X3 [Oncorhynchus tshawytscha]|uniref:prolyl 3-hydroxylase 2 isoform X3 n=1 Tax=Oncorhynchus tshawytscha TaxID=74940 RepID=UPI000D0A080C|nr:prolyl 3-hydroxylase 2 isoform X3 [Oncorhynchus tshawytscha]